MKEEQQLLLLLLLLEPSAAVWLAEKVYRCAGAEVGMANVFGVGVVTACADGAPFVVVVRIPADLGWARDMSDGTKEEVSKEALALLSVEIVR